MSWETHREREKERKVHTHTHTYGVSYFLLKDVCECIFVHVYAHVSGYLRSPEETIGCPEGVVADCCELPDVGDRD